MPVFLVTLNYMDFRKSIFLKKAINHIVPTRILKRRKKGFGVPIERWIRGDLKEMVFDVLLSEPLDQKRIFSKRGRVSYAGRPCKGGSRLPLSHLEFIDARVMAPDVH